MSVADRSMGLGLRALNNLAGMEVLDRVGLREPIQRLVYQGAKNGFRAAGAGARAFKATQRLGGPARQAAVAPSGLFDLEPTDEQQALKEAFGEFAADRIRPAAAGADAACAAPKELLDQSAELGLAVLGVPEELGGVMAERSAVTAVLAAEALAHGDMGIAVAALAPSAVSTAISLWGDADQQARYLEPFTGDDVPAAALAILEPGALFDPFALKTTARRDGDAFALDGTKALVPRGADAELLIVAAALDGAPALFVVEPAGGGVRAAAEPAMGVRAAATATLQLDGARGALLGGGTAAPDPAVYAECVARARVAWCALAVGAGQAVLDLVIPYVNERIAFGEPISHRQSVAFKVSDIAIELDGMRLATYRAAARADAGRPFAREAALARQLCAEKGMQIGSDGVQLLGGHGYVKEYPAERWYRDLRAAGAVEGALLV